MRKCLGGYEGVMSTCWVDVGYECFRIPTMYEAVWKRFERNRREVLEKMCKSRKVLETHPSPIFLILKFYVGRE